MQNRIWLSLLAGMLIGLPVRAEVPEWARTLERISSGVVSIRVDSTRAFDTEWNSSSQATGFVVDAERGLILTNRHVVTPGPVVAEAIFLNNEEVRLTPIYRDPVHDFGFYRYDPKDLVYIKPTELPLVPGAAGIGSEIRVVGNDAGEQLSILAGTIARLDRQAPDYGRGKYNDFNTFYFQAASGTSGGSSGSPVINIEGEVVALNAGGASTAASSFFLPLDRINRALNLIRNGEAVTRGTLQTMFEHKPFDELRRLGLTKATENQVRSDYPKQTGMLTISQVIPESPAYGKLEPGDILVKVNDVLVTEFIPVAAIFDNKVGQSVAIEVERGGRSVREEIIVSDLHEISPDEFLEFGDAVVHNLSYQQARHYNHPVEGVYVANPGYIFAKSAIPRGAIISEIGGEPISNIEELESKIATLAHGDRTTFRFTTIDDPQNSIVRSVEMERMWFPAQHCRRNDESGVWPCEDLTAGPAPSPPVSGSTQFTKNGDSRVNAVAPSLVMVTFDLPYTVSGVAERHYYGTGLIVDKERGLVVVDRNTVPVGMGDVSITFAGSLQVNGRVEYVHPLHNLAIVSYDPTLIGDTPVKSAIFSKEVLEPGDDVWVIGLKGDHQIVHQASTVASVDPMLLPLSRTMRFRDTNLEGISLVNAPGDIDGVIVNKRGEVVAKWVSFAYESGGESGQVNRGLSSEMVSEFVDIVRSGKPVYSLEVELGYTPLFAARKLGLDEEWLDKLEAKNPSGRRALSVSRLVAGAPAADLLVNGDMILAVDGNLVTTFRELERAVQKNQVVLTVWRDGEAVEIETATVALGGDDVVRAVSWAGALLHDPHRAMAAQRGIKPTGVYIAFFSYGSPATRYGLWAGRRIVAVDDTDTPDLQSFVDVVSGKDDQSSVRVKTVSWNGVVQVITLKLDNQYWPTYEILRTDEGWHRAPIG
ncbi:MAG: PDZ domain-containing protein [Proteobacteria bacterium]|nr:PDZ domain-containing protein [Pseudomonadota bacterium]MDA0992517.1 PDZ domain-containing protein [Pseudomonadota bacterium]